MNADNAAVIDTYACDLVASVRAKRADGCAGAWNCGRIIGIGAEGLRVAMAHVHDVPARLEIRFVPENADHRSARMYTDRGSVVYSGHATEPPLRVSGRVIGSAAGPDGTIHLDVEFYSLSNADRDRLAQLITTVLS